uniref:Uncharacterized protein n=1 Tax=Strigamia maritima TaxID=126957 RepID=T1IMI1_STRMM
MPKARAQEGVDSTTTNPISIVDNDEDTSSFHAFAVLFVAVNVSHVTKPNRLQPCIMCYVPPQMMMENNHRMAATLFFR